MFKSMLNINFSYLLPVYLTKLPLIRCRKTRKRCFFRMAYIGTIIAFKVGIEDK